MLERPEPVAIIAKNTREDVRVSIERFSGVDLVDIRTFVDYVSGNVQGRGPTKKGVSLNIAKLPDLIAALETARGEAERRGLLPVADAART